MESPNLSTHTQPSQAPTLSPRRKWGMLVVLSLALAIIILDTTILNVALSSIIKDLNTDIQSIQWVITAYSLTLAALTITGGRMGDIFGRKRMFVFGAFLFAVGSFLASISTNVATLIAGESIIEGIGAALMMPATASLLVANFSGRDRAVAFGVWGGIAGASAALGPIVGGFLATNYNWRWGFRVNLIIVALLLLGSFIIPESRDQKEKPELDLVGVFLSATGMLSLIFGVIESTKYGWWKAKAVFHIFNYAITMPWDLSVVPFFIGIGVLIIGLFLAWESAHERRGHTPLVSPKIFANRTFASGVATTTVMSLGQTGLIFSLPVFLQAVRSLDAYHTGLALLPMSLPLLIVAPLSAVLGKKISPKVLIVCGLTINVIAYGIMYATLSVDTTVSDLIPGLAIFGIGMGLVMSQINNFTLSAVEPHQAGEASGVNNTLRQVGSTLGSAVVGTILVGSLGTHLSQGVMNSQTLPEAYKAPIATALSTQSSAIEFGGGAHLGSNIPDAVMQTIVDISHHATVDAAKETLFFGACLAFAGLLAATLLLPNKKAQRIAASEPQIEAKPKTPSALLTSSTIDSAVIAKLITVDATRINAGEPGLGNAVQAILDRAELGDVQTDHRMLWARRYWELGIGTALGFTSFADYAKTIPEVPPELLKDSNEFPYLVLVEARVSPSKLCELLNIHIKHDGNLAAIDAMNVTGNPAWTRMRVATDTRGLSVTEATAQMNTHESLCGAHEGVALFVMYPDSITDRYLDLPKTPHDTSNTSAACLGIWGGNTELRWRWTDHADPRCVTATKFVV